MLRHIAWFNEASIEPDPKGGLRSADERVRRRCLEPASALEDRGVCCSVFGNLHDASPADVGQMLQKLETDVVVIGAFTEPTLLKLAKTAKHLGCYIVADFADQTTMSADFEKLGAFADLIVAATPEAIKTIETANLVATLVPDDSSDAWLDCFKALKMKPPACANSNIPPDHV